MTGKPIGDGRSRGRVGLAALLGVALAMLAFAGAALGYFSTKGAGASPVAVGSLTVPTISSAKAAAGGTVTLTWAETNAPKGVAYYVTRNGGTPGGNCPTHAEPENEISTCTDTGLEPGTYTYTVTAKYRTWSATSGPSSAKVTVGPVDHFVLTVASSSVAAGASDNLTITAKDAAGSTVTTYTGTRALVFSGAESSPGGNAPTVAATGGANEPFGEPTNISFTAGVAKVNNSKNGVMKLYDAGAATISVSGESIESEPDPTVTVTPLAMSKLALSAATTEPTAGQADPLTAAAVDTYGNTVTSYTGSKNLTFSGASAGPDGDQPTVTNASGTAVAFGSTTATTFAAGVARVNGTKNGVMKLYKTGAANITVAEGKTTSAALVVTTQPAEAAELTVTATSSKPVAGAADNLKTTAFDLYGNTDTAYEGPHSIVFSGAEASPAGTAPTVADDEGTAVEFGHPVSLEFNAGVATVSGTKNGVMKLAHSGATTVLAAGEAIKTPAELAVTVATGAAARFAWEEPAITAGTLGTPCLFTCTIAKFGNGGAFVAAVAVTDSLGNVIENLGSGHSVTVTVSGVGTVTGGALKIASTGLAESETTFTYKSKSSGSFTDTITAARSAGTTYTSATATVTK